MKIVITGGHFSPAYSVIKKLDSSDSVLVIGRKYAFEGDKNETYEYKICEKNNIPFKVINAGRFQRKFTHHTIPAVTRFPKGIYSALKILKEFKPDVVVTFGGYVGLAVSLAARILNIPIVLHEQTQKAGLSARIIGKFASVILISFESSRAYFKNKKVVLTGNPIREELFQKSEIFEFEAKPIIYITGGSTGAHVLNQVILEILPRLLLKYTVFHQTGNNTEYKDFGKIQEFYDVLSPQLKKNYTVKQFFSPLEVSCLLQNASLVISRAGINTVTELMAIGVVGLLIPLPHGQMNEQRDNAVLFKKIGLGEYIEQKFLTGDLLLEKVHDMIKEQKKYKENAKYAGEYIHKDATNEIIDQLYLYGRKGKK